jgi:hypothetical protein
MKKIIFKLAAGLSYRTIERAHEIEIIIEFARPSPLNKILKSKIGKADYVKAKKSEMIAKKVQSASGKAIRPATGKVAKKRAPILAKKPIIIEGTGGTGPRLQSERTGGIGPRFD